MKSALFIIFTGLINTLVPLWADEWIGLEEDDPVLLGVELGRDESESLSQTVNVGLALGDTAGFTGSYSNTQLSDGIKQFDSLSLNSTFWFELSELIELDLLYQFEGNQDELEKESYRLGLGYQGQEWQVQVHLTSGDLLIFTRDEIFDLFGAEIPDRFSTDLEGRAISIGQQRENWYWQAIHTRYDYERNISLLGSSPFLQFIVKASALAQSSILLSNSTRFLVGYNTRANDYAVTLSRDRSAIDHSDNDTIFLSLNHWSNDDIGYLLGVSLPVEADGFGLTLGLQWTL